MDRRSIFIRRPLCGGRKDFFFEKKKQKTFGCLAAAYPADVRKGIEVFWFFFSKKNRFLPRPRRLLVKAGRDIREQAAEVGLAQAA
jgi:hypothetical protein